MIHLTNTNPFENDDDNNEIHIRLITQGRKYTTIIEGLKESIDWKTLLSKLNKTFHCSGEITIDKKYGKIIKLMGNHKDGIKELFVNDEILEKTKFSYMVNKSKLFLIK